jgi:hypothetical protein
MRTLLLSIATAASALAIASPATAQWGQPQGYGYNNGGYHHRGHARMLDDRIDRLQKEIRRLDKRNVLSEREADRLIQQSRELEARLARLSRNGFSGRESAAIENGIARLEQRIFRDARDGRGWNDRGYGYNQGGFIDRDRDGRDDRYEDDRGSRRD